MKHRGATMEYGRERTADLMRVYDEYIASCTRLSMSEAYRHVAAAPAARFYVSEGRAGTVVRAMLRGRPLTGMRRLKREMFEEILRRVLALRRRHPEWTVSRLCAVVVRQPAPKFYITAGSAKVMVCRARKEWNEEKLKKVRRWCLPQG